MPTHEEILAAWQGLNNDERFRALSYEEQQKVRAQWAERNLPKDPTFTAMSRGGQARAFQNLVTQPPVFSETNDFVTETMEVAQAAREGNPEALRAGAAQVAGHRATKEAGPIYRIATEIGERIGIEGPARTEPGSEDEKAVQYLEQVMASSDDKTFWQSALMGIAPFVGIGANILSGRVAAGPVLAANRYAGTRAAASRLADSRFKRWVFRSALPETFESGLDATMMLTNDLISQQVEQNIPFGIEARSRAGNIALNFGTNFVGDMVFFGVASAAGAMIKNTAKVGLSRLGNRAVPDVSDEVLTEMTRKTLTGEELSRNVLDTLPEESLRTYRRYQRAFQSAEHLEDMSAGERAEFVALGKGYEIVKDGESFAVRSVVTGYQLPSHFSTETRALRGLMDFMESPPAQKAKALDMAATNEVTVERVARARFGDTVPELDSGTLARTLTPGEGGRLQPEPIQTATRAMVRQAGGAADVANKIEVRSVSNDAYWKMSDEARVTESRIYVPEYVRTSEEMTRFLDRYSADVGKVVPEGTEAVRRYVTDVAQRTGEVQSATNPVYVEANALQHGIELQPLGNGTWRVGDRVVDSIKQADEAVQRQVMLRSDDAIHEAYGRQFGFEFVQGENGWHVRGKMGDKGGNVLTGNHETVRGAADELWEKGFKPRMTQQQAPYMVITPEGDGLEIRKLGEGPEAPNVVRGPIEYVTEFAKQYFADIPDGKILRKLGTATIEKAQDLYRVSSPEWGVIDTFTSFKKAQDFLTASRNTLEELQNMGLLKGVPDISINGGVIVARPIGEAAKTFDSVSALKDWLKAHTPSPIIQKELSNIDTETLSRVWDDMPDDLKENYLRHTGVSKPKDWSDILNYMENHPTWQNKVPTGEYGKGRAYGYGMTQAVQFMKDFVQSPKYQRVRRIVGQEGEEFLGKSFEQAEKQLKNFRAIHTQTSELVDSISRFNGAPKRKRRTALRPLLEVPAEEVETKARLWNIDLTDSDRRYMRRFRQVTEALGQNFGIDSYKLISGYLPRMRQFIKDNPDVLAKASTAREITGQVESRMAKELDFFAENLRVDELVTFLNEADPQEILAAYTRKGVKNMTLGKTYNILKAKWDEVVPDGSVDNKAKFLLFHHLEQLMGMYSDEASKAAEQSARETAAVIANGLKAGPAAGAIKDYVNMLHGLTIASVMSFRPWPIIRNMQQIWTTLAPMFGNDTVMRAMKYISTDAGGEETYTRLVRSGRLQDRIPIFGGVYEAEGKIGRLNKIGMKWYKNSDDYTRMVVDRAVRETFTDAVAKFEANPNMGEKKFIRLANLHRLDDFDQKEVIRRLQGDWTDAEGRVHAGGFDAAVDYYGDIVTRETMFAYTAGSNPMSFDGMWGRLFGMFGHYPVYYAQTIFNGLKRGNLLDKAQFAGRVAFNSAVLWAAFEGAWGIRADDFKPWKTMFFDGGPYFKLLSNALSAAAGSPYSNWDMVFQDAGRLFTPGSLQFRSINEGLKLMQEGRSYDGFLRLMSAPLAED